MRDYTGVAYDTLPPTDDPNFQPRVRGALQTIDYFLRDLSRGLGRIQNGQVPDGSGTSIITVADNGKFFLLAGRSGGQTGYGDTSPSGSLTLGSTADTTKGSIFLGTSGVFDEANKRLGIGTITPSVKFEVHQTGTNVNFAPSSTVSGTPQWRGSDGGSSLQTYVDETTSDDSDFISDGTNLGTTVRLGLPNITPQANTATITISFRIGWTGTNGGTAGVNTLNLKLRDGAGTTIHTDSSLNGYVASGAHGNVAYQTVAFTLSSGEITSIANWNGMSLQIESGGGGTGYAGSVTCSWMQFSIVGGTAVDLVNLYDLSDILRFKISKDGYTTTPQLLLSGSTSGTLTHLPAATTTSHSLTWPSAQGAASTVLSNNGSGALSWSTGATLGYVTLTGTQTITGQKTFDADNGGAPIISGTDDGLTTLMTIHGTSSGFDMVVQMSPLSAGRTIAFPDGSGAIVLAAATQGLQNKTLGSGCLINCGASGVLSGANTKFQRGSSTTIYTQLDLSALTTTRVTAFADITAQLVQVGDAADPPASSGQIGKVNRTAQSAAIGSTVLTNSTPSGMYLVHYEMTCTTGDGTAGTLTFDVICTGDQGAQTVSSAALDLKTATTSGTNPIRGTQERFLTSGNITYTTTVTGAVNAARYALRVRCEFLG